MRKLPILIFGIIQKPLQIKSSKQPGDESINKTSEHIWQPVTSSSFLVFHNTFVGQLFCKHNYYNIQLSYSCKYSVGAYFKRLLHVLPAHNAFFNFLWQLHTSKTANLNALDSFIFILP